MVLVYTVQNSIHFFQCCINIAARKLHGKIINTHDRGFFENQAPLEQAVRVVTEN